MGGDWRTCWMGRGWIGGSWVGRAGLDVLDWRPMGRGPYFDGPGNSEKILNLACLAPRVLAANAGSGSGAAVSITGSGDGPTPVRGASHASQWRALATLFNVHVEQFHGMCWLCTFGASCALNVIGIVAQRVPSRFRARLRELGLEASEQRTTSRARQLPERDNFASGDSL